MTRKLTIQESVALRDLRMRAARLQRDLHHNETERFNLQKDLTAVKATIELIEKGIWGGDDDAD